MTHLTKLTFKTVDRSMKRDPIINRRDKLIAGLKEQKLVHVAALKKQDHLVERNKWMQNDTGERVLVKTHRRIRPWFFAQDGGPDKALLRDDRHARGFPISTRPASHYA